MVVKVYKEKKYLRETEGKAYMDRGGERVDRRGNEQDRHTSWEDGKKENGPNEC